MSNLSIASFEFSIDSNRSRYYFIFTEECSAHNKRIRCHQGDFGDLCLTYQNPPLNYFATANGFQNLRDRIVASLDLSFEENDWDTMQKLAVQENNVQENNVQENNVQENKDLKGTILQTILPLAKIYVYCAPCACAIGTAIRICYTYDKDSRLSWLIRVDEQISASCCPEDSKRDRLESLVAAIKKFEIAQSQAHHHSYSAPYIQYIDRVCLEQRLYHIDDGLEAEIPPVSSMDAAKKIFSEVDSPEKRNVHIVLGEVSRCA